MNPVPDISEQALAFKVPAGETRSGRLVRARDASPDVKYHCPGCGTPLLLRKGAVRSPHFAHKNHGHCSPETALHKGVKNWIAQILRKGLKGKRAGSPWVLVPCAGLPHSADLDFPWKCPGEAWWSLADLAFDDVAVEHSTPDGLRPDVLLLQQGRPILGIEILVCHAVDAAKAAKTSFPWLELDARRVLASPRRWKPSQYVHTWTTQCQVCACIGMSDQADLSEVTDPGDYVAQIAAGGFHGQLQNWLQSTQKRLKPAVCWRCPGCRKPNVRPLCRDRIQGLALASSLGASLHPQVILQVKDGSPIFISFAFPKNPHRPWAVVPLASGEAALRATPSLKQPHRLALNGTNRPLAFICRRCGSDCLGACPSPMTPWGLETLIECCPSNSMSASSRPSKAGSQAPAD
jgi:hypothetical protein